MNNTFPRYGYHNSQNMWRIGDCVMHYSVHVYLLVARSHHKGKTFAFSRFFDKSRTPSEKWTKINVHFRQSQTRIGKKTLKK